MRRIALFIIPLFIASGALGWLSAGTSAGPRSADVDNWEALLYRPVSPADYKAMATSLKQSALLPLSAKEVQAQAAAAAAAENTSSDVKTRAAKPFPKIIGHYRLNNKRYIQVRNADATVSKLQQGDVHDTGWEIKTVDRRRVIAVFDGEELEIPIIAYLEAAFQKPEEDGTSDGTDTESGGE